MKYIYVALSLAACIVFNGSQLFAQQLAPVNPAFTKYIKNEKVATGGKNLSGASAGTQNEHPLGAIPPIINIDRINKVDISSAFKKSAVNNKSNSSGKPNSGASVTDSSYDLRNTANILSPVRDQGACGNCWTYATYSSLESNLRKISQVYDFNEAHMSATHGFVWGQCDGGNSEMSIAYLSRWSGPVAQDTTSPVLKHMQNAYWLPQPHTGGYDTNFIGNVKAALISDGPVQISFNAHNEFWSDNSTYFYAPVCSRPFGTSGEDYNYCDKDNGQGHAVSIIGWDDSVSKNNFTRIISGTTYTPSGDGAFIVRNSWGTAYGDSGYFYMSYYDTSVGAAVAYETVEDTTNFSKVFSYDDYGMVSALRPDDTGIAWGSNVFTADANSELKAVSFYTTNVNVKYEIHISTGVTGNSPYSQYDVMVASGTMVASGYHTVHFNSNIAPIIVKTNESFAVKIKFVDEIYDNYPLAVETNYADYLEAASSAQNQSWYSNNGTNWTDLTSLASDANLPIKVFAYQDQTAPIMVDVRDGTAADIEVTESETQLSANWDSAQEPPSGISRYEYAIGTSAGTTDVLGWTSNGTQTSVTKTGLSLEFGTTYYFGVRAYNAYDVVSDTVWSNGQRLFYKRPGNIQYVNDGVTDDVDYILNTGFLAANWGDAAYTDPETQLPVEDYEFAIGSSKGGTDIKNWMSNGTSKNVVVSSTLTSNGRSFFFSVRARSSNGKYSDLAFSDGMTVDTVTPEITYINVPNRVPFGDFTGTFIMNKSYITMVSSPTLSYQVTGDAEPTPLTVTRIDDTTWRYSGLIQSTEHQVGIATFTFSATSLSGLTGTNIVEGKNFTVIINEYDTTPPDVSHMTVRDGLGVDTNIASSENSLSANWDEVVDAESGIKEYLYAIGTVAGYHNTLDWTSNGTVNYVTHTGLPLVVGTTYYFSIKAVNNAGLESQVRASNGQWVDAMGPGEIPYINCGLGNLNEDYSNNISSMSANWGASSINVAAEKLATGYEYAIGRDISDLTNVSSWSSIGKTYSFTATGLSLYPEGAYYFSVRAYNALGYFSEIKTCRQVIDRTIPKVNSITIDGGTQRSFGELKGHYDINKDVSLLAEGWPKLSYKADNSTYTVRLESTLQPDGNNRIYDFSGFINTYYSTGPAHFFVEIKDKAGNTGTNIFGGASFTISAGEDVSVADALFQNEDGFAVEVPMGATNGQIIVQIQNVPESDEDLINDADRNSTDSVAPRLNNLVRKYTAKDLSDGGSEINTFARDVNIIIPYPDSDNDNRTDGDFLDVNTLFIHYLNPTSRRWVSLANSKIDTQKHIVQAKTNHFSIYSLRALSGSALQLNVKPSPNPCKFSLYSTMVFNGLPPDRGNVKLRIYNVAGELVNSLDFDTAQKVEWDGKTKNGSKVASGLYIYHIKTDKRGNQKGKIYIMW